MFIEIQTDDVKLFCKDINLNIRENKYGLAVSMSDGYKLYYVNGKLHNEYKYETWRKK